MPGPVVFVSGPLSAGSWSLNVRRAVLAADALADAGAVPIVPHLFATWDAIAPRPYEEWMRLCLGLVPLADGLLRLGGLSPGADREVALAESLGIKVWTNALEAAEEIRAAEVERTERRAVLEDGLKVCEACEGLGYDPSPFAQGAPVRASLERDA